MCCIFLLKILLLTYCIIMFVYVVCTFIKWPLSTIFICMFYSKLAQGSASMYYIHIEHQQGINCITVRLDKNTFFTNKGTLIKSYFAKMRLSSRSIRKRSYFYISRLSLWACEEEIVKDTCPLDDINLHRIRRLRESLWHYANSSSTDLASRTVYRIRVHRTLEEQSTYTKKATRPTSSTYSREIPYCPSCL